MTATNQAPTVTEVMFYHLDRQTLDAALPLLVEKTLERGWRAVIQAGSDERVQALDALLWTYKPDSFVPHGTAADGDATRQPIFLTASMDNPNGAVVRFLVDGAALETYSGYRRIVVMFNGRDEHAVKDARDQWRRAKSSGGACTYWQQTASGGWEKKA